MTDYFALLGEPRHPWLDTESLKQKFLTISAAVHPDRVHNLGENDRATAQERYTELNAAYNCLREPKDRLRHLLQLETQAAPRDLQRIPSELMDLSLEIGRQCREADAFLSEKAKATSPLLQVKFFQEGQEFAERLGTLRQNVISRTELLHAELRQIDAAWPPAADLRSETFARLEEIYRLLGYFTRWSGQIQERAVRISF